MNAPKNKPAKSLAQKTFPWAAGGIALLLTLNLLVGNKEAATAQPTTASITAINREVEQRNVKSVSLSGGNLIVELKDGKRLISGDPGDKDLVQRLVRDGVEVQVPVAQPTESSRVGEFLLSFGPVVLLIAVMLYIFRKQSSGAGRALPNIGKANAKKLSENAPKVLLKDVAGCDEAKYELQEIVEFLKDPGRFQKLGGKIPRGVLMAGPPGTGKTLLARAVAGEAGVPFLTISGSSFVEMFVGVGAARVRDLFAQAKAMSPCIIFIDEIDTVGRARGTGVGGGNDEREQTLNQMLVEMDGFEPNSAVIVIAATNRPDVLDRALLRPGRFDRQVTVGLPDIRGREQILEVHMRKIPVAIDVDVNRIARGTPGFAGADLANLVNEAALFAARRSATHVSNHDFEAAKDKVLMGPERRSMVMPEYERRNTAYHEAGHAIVARLLPKTDPVHKVTIIPRGRALGLTMQLPDEDRYSTDKTRLLSTIAVLYGGRVAEELFMGDATTGASNDFERATAIARNMVTRWGYSRTLGPMVLANNDTDPYAGSLVSPETLREVDSEIRQLLGDQYAVVTSLLKEHADKVHVMAKALLDWETIDMAQIDQIMAGQVPSAPARSVSTIASPAAPANVTLEAESSTAPVTTPV